MTRAGDWPKTGFAGRLRELREGMGLSQAGLAGTSGLTVNTVYRLEAGRSEPAWPIVLVLARALGVTPDAFMVAEGDVVLPPPPRRPPGRPKKPAADPPSEGQEKPKRGRKRKGGA